VLPHLQAEADLLESEIGNLKKKVRKGKSIEREEIRVELQTKKKALADVKPGTNPATLGVAKT
jgi:hypothetical protein